MSEIEIWKDISEFEGLYQVSNFGRVRSCDKFEYIANPHGTFTLRKKRGVLRIAHLDGRGYHKVGLWKDGVKINAKIHRLVASAFIDNIENKPEVNHKDRDKTNNHVSNLEWSTRSENEIHKRNSGKDCKATWAANHKGRQVINTKSGKVYQSAKEAAAELGIGYDYAQSMLRGVRPNNTPLKYANL